MGVYLVTSDSAWPTYKSDVIGGIPLFSSVTWWHLPSSLNVHWSQILWFAPDILLKYIYSENATKFCKLHLTFVLCNASKK